jgi:hypothetical protein
MATETAFGRSFRVRRLTSPLARGVRWASDACDRSPHGHAFDQIWNDRADRLKISQPTLTEMLRRLG